MICGVVLFIILGSTTVAWSQESGVATDEVLTVEQAVALAFTQNRQVKNAALEVEKAADDIAASRQTGDRAQRAHARAGDVVGADFPGVGEPIQ